MFLWDDIKSYLKELKLYAFGKGILTLLVFGTAATAAAFGVTSIMLPAAIAAIGGTLLTAANRLNRQSIYEQKMVDFYRDGIAEQLHIAPEDVTRKHLRAVAPENPVIAQALDRQHKKSILVISTAVFSSAVSLFLLGVFDAASILKDLATENITGMLKPLVRLVGMGTVSTMCGLVLHDGLDALIGYSTGIGRASANDLIMGIDQQVARGQAISREQVYEALIAANPVLQHKIQQQFGAAYGAMNHAQKSKVLHTYGVAAITDELAQNIAQGRLSASTLAQIDLGQSTALVPASVQEKTKDKASFVDRLERSTKPAMSHTEQLAAQTDLQTAAAR